MITVEMITVEMNTFHCKGAKNGQVDFKVMRFPNWDLACKWAGTQTMDVVCPFVVLEMRNAITGQKEWF